MMVGIISHLHNLIGSENDFSSFIYIKQFLKFFDERSSWTIIVGEIVTIFKCQGALVLIMRTMIIIEHRYPSDFFSVMKDKHISIINIRKTDIHSCRWRVARKSYRDLSSVLRPIRRENRKQSVIQIDPRSRSHNQIDCIVIFTDLERRKAQNEEYEIHRKSWRRSIAMYHEWHIEICLIIWKISWAIIWDTNAAQYVSPVSEWSGFVGRSMFKSCFYSIFIEYL